MCETGTTFPVDTFIHTRIQYTTRGAFISISAYCEMTRVISYETQLLIRNKLILSATRSRRRNSVMLFSYFGGLSINPNFSEDIVVIQRLFTRQIDNVIDPILVSDFEIRRPKGKWSMKLLRSFSLRAIYYYAEFLSFLTP